MAEQIFNINIEGYWRCKNLGGLPKYSGIFLVYEACYNQKTDTVTLKNLLYIGEAENINEDILAGSRIEDWKRNLEAGNELCFSAGYINTENRRRAAAAMIYELKPMMNTEFKDSFLYEETSVILSGETSLLKKEILVNKTAELQKSDKINWSYTAVNYLRQCNRKYYFSQILAHYGRNDKLRRKAYELKRMQNVAMWQGSVIDKILETEVIPAIANKIKLDYKNIAQKAVELAKKRYKFSEEKKYLDPKINKGDSEEEFCILDIHEINTRYDEESIAGAYEQIAEIVRRFPEIQMPDGKTHLVDYLTSASILLPNVQNWMVTIEGANVKPQIDLIIYKNWKPVVIDWKVSESSISDYSKQLTIAGLVVYLKRVEKAQKEGKKPYTHDEIKLYEVNLAKRIVREYEFTEESANDMIDYINLTCSDIRLLKADSEEEKLPISSFDITSNNNTCKYCNFRTLCAHLIINNYEYHENIYLKSIQAE